jgi:hypothetical protein
MARLELELDQREATIADFNPRAELNGEEKRPAADIRLVIPVNSDILAHFAPTLKAHIFNENGPRDLADGPPLRYPEIGAFSWNAEMLGAKLIIGTGLKSLMTFEDAKISKFVIDPKEGGGVLLSLRAQVHPDEKQAGKLSMLIQQTVTVSLEPAELPTMEEKKAA